MTKKTYTPLLMFQASSVNQYSQSSKDLITSDNLDAWKDYLYALLHAHVTEETMHTPEFLACVERVEQRKLSMKKYELQKKKEAEARRRRSVMERPRINYIPKGLNVDYEKEYSRYLEQEVTFIPEDEDDFLNQLRLIERWAKKSIPQILELNRPDAAYAIAITVCRHIPLFINRDDIEEYLKSKKSRIRILIVSSFTALADTVTAWNNEEKRRFVCDFIFQQCKEYTEFRGLTKELLTLCPSESFVGEPVAVTKEMNDEELRQQRLEREAEKRRIAEEKERLSLIPINPDYEKFFAKHLIGWNCSRISNLMYAESRNIEGLLNSGKHKEAALRFMQLTKSMCRHFISDEHWCYFDDMYDPDYVVRTLCDNFRESMTEGKLDIDTIEYLKAAWKEIIEMESYKSYYVPSVREFI